MRGRAESGMAPGRPRAALIPPGFLQWGVVHSLDTDFGTLVHVCQDEDGIYTGFVKGAKWEVRRWEATTAQCAITVSVLYCFCTICGLLMRAFGLHAHCRPALAGHERAQHAGLQLLQQMRTTSLLNVLRLLESASSCALRAARWRLSTRQLRQQFAKASVLMEQRSSPLRAECIRSCTLHVLTTR